MLKKTVILLLIPFCISCKEKPKPFTYDYVEIGYRDGWLSGHSVSFKIDSNKRCYINKWNLPCENSCFVGYLNDTIQSEIDSIAYFVNRDSTVISANDNCADCGKMAVYMSKNKKIKVYYVNPKNTDIDNKLYKVCERIRRIRNQNEFKSIDTSLNSVVVYLIAPPIPPPPPPQKTTISIKE